MSEPNLYDHPVDRNGFEVLSREECLDLMATVPIGRVVVTVGALPAAFPVRFAVMDDDILFLTRVGAKLDAALNETVVAFEADSYDVDSGTGWSVLVRGRASLITSPGGIDALVHAGLTPPGTPAMTVGVRVRTELVSGRRAPHFVSAPMLPPRRRQGFRAIGETDTTEHIGVFVLDAERRSRHV